MNKKYVIFDMDGTLVDSMGYWGRLGYEFLRSKGITGDLEPILRKTKPMTMSESSAMFIREFGLSGTPESVAEEMRKVMDVHYHTDVPLKPGVREYLDKLRQEGVAMCVASATPSALIRVCLTRLGVADYFDFLLSCDEVGVGKNSPDVFLEAARRMGGEPADTAVFEDAIYAAETAKKAGFYTVGVYDVNSDYHWERLQTVADKTIRDWSEAVEAL